MTFDILGLLSVLCQNYVIYLCRAPFTNQNSPFSQPPNQSAVLITANYNWALSTNQGAVLLVMLSDPRILLVSITG